MGPLYKLLLMPIFLAGSLLLSPNVLAKDLKSNVIILLDFSNSYFTSERASEIIPDNIRDIAKLIGNKRNGPKRPALIQLLPIDSASEIARPYCTYRLQKKKLIGGADKDCGGVDEAFCSSKSKNFISYMDEACIERIKKNKEDNATDISGALALSSQIGRSQTDGSKYLVIFSDMFEYRYEELPVSKIDLTDFNILVVCGGFFNTEQDSSKLCMADQDSWKSRFAELGAKNVYYTIEAGDWISGVGKGFFDND